MTRLERALRKLEAERMLGLRDRADVAARVIASIFDRSHLLEYGTEIDGVHVRIWGGRGAVSIVARDQVGIAVYETTVTRGAIASAGQITDGIVSALESLLEEVE